MENIDGAIRISEIADLLRAEYGLVTGNSSKRPISDNLVKPSRKINPNFKSQSMPMNPHNLIHSLQANG